MQSKNRNPTAIVYPTAVILLDEENYDFSGIDAQIRRIELMLCHSEDFDLIPNMDLEFI